MPHLSVPASATSAAVLHLYRRIIKNAKVFPSKGRDRMLKEIREGNVPNTSFPFFLDQGRHFDRSVED
jgi:hypothetical protein